MFLTHFPSERSRVKPRDRNLHTQTEMADENVTEKRAKKRGGRVAILTGSEKKRRKKEYDKKLAKSRVYIGSTVDRWKALKQRINVKTDEEMANMLIERRVLFFDDYISRGKNCKNGVYRIMFRSALDNIILCIIELFDFTSNKK